MQEKAGANGNVCQRHFNNLKHIHTMKYPIKNYIKEMPAEIMQVCEINITYKSKGVPMQERPKINTSSLGADALRPIMVEFCDGSLEDHEVFAVMFLNREMRPICVSMISKGAVDSCVVDYAKIVGLASVIKSCYAVNN